MYCMSWALRNVRCNGRADLYKSRITNKEKFNDIITPITIIVNKTNLWHLHLGHINQNILKSK
jgi:hypothetical protein